MAERKSNLELLRILSMSGIIFIHYVGAELGGAVVNGDFPNFSWFFVHFFNAFFVPLVNCFVLISGYFMVNSKNFSLKKPISILVICAFHGVISYLIALLAGIEPHEGGIIYALFPYFWGNRWFVETYVMLLLIAPFINKLLNSITKESYHILMAVWISLFCLWYSVGLSAPILDDGYGIINFITLYFLGAYIRKYGSESKILSIRKRYCALIFIVCSFATFVLSYFINPYGYSFITNIIGSVAAFMFFEKWDIESNKILNSVSAATFDVYFVHSDFNTSHLFIYYILGARFVVDSPWMMLHVIIVIIAMWVLGLAVYYFRKALFSFTVDKLLDKIKFISKKTEI